MTAAFGAHVAMTVAALFIVAIADWPVALRIVSAVVIAAILLPWLQILFTARTERFTGLALLLVVVIGAGLVEVMATGGALSASVLLGAAMLEFALLFSLTRRRSH